MEDNEIAELLNQYKDTIIQQNKALETQQKQILLAGLFGIFVFIGTNLIFFYFKINSGYLMYLPTILTFVLILLYFIGKLMITSLSDYSKFEKIENQINEIIKKKYGVDNLLQTPSIEIYLKENEEQILSKLEQIFDKLELFNIKIYGNNILIEGTKKCLPAFSILKGSLISDLDVYKFQRVIVKWIEDKEEFKIKIYVTGPLRGLNYQLLKKIENELSEILE